MPNTKLTQVFNMTQAELAQLADMAVKLIARDPELSIYGIDNAYMQNLAAKTELYKQTPTDEELQGEVSDKTEQKNRHADELKIMIRSVAVRAKLVFGGQSAAYRSFGVKALDKLDDDKLYRCARTVQRRAVKYFAELAPRGLTQADIDALSAQTANLLIAVEEKIDADAERETGTETRTRLGNELYNLISEIFECGKDYWASRNEARYNDYVVYDTRQKNKPAHQPGE
jgi:hypothetical protein